MASSGTITVAYSGGGKSYTCDITESGSARVNVEEAITDSTTDGQVIVPAIDVSALQLVYVYSDQDLTIETNDGTTPDDTLALKADEPYIWHVSALDTNLFTTDIGTNGIYATNASGATANLYMEFILDATP